MQLTMKVHFKTLGLYKKPTTVTEMARSVLIRVRLLSSGWHRERQQGLRRVTFLSGLKLTATRWQCDPAFSMLPTRAAEIQTTVQRFGGSKHWPVSLNPDS